MVLYYIIYYYFIWLKHLFVLWKHKLLPLSVKHLNTETWRPGCPNNDRRWTAMLEVYGKTTIVCYLVCFYSRFQAYFISKNVFRSRRGPPPCGLHVAGCWTRWWAPGRSAPSSQALELEPGRSASPPALDTPPTPPPAPPQEAQAWRANLVDLPSRCSDERLSNHVSNHPHLIPAP